MVLGLRDGAGGGEEGGVGSGGRGENIYIYIYSSHPLHLVAYHICNVGHLFVASQASIQVLSGSYPPPPPPPPRMINIESHMFPLPFELFRLCIQFISFTVLTAPTIAPPKTGGFLQRRTNVFMAARHEEGCYEKSILEQFHVRKGLSNDDVGAARGTIFQETRPGAGFKTGDFVQEKLRGLPENGFLYVPFNPPPPTLPRCPHRCRRPSSACSKVLFIRAA